jgi:uncharacterized membrane protein
LGFSLLTPEGSHVFTMRLNRILGVLISITETMLWFSCHVKHLKVLVSCFLSSFWYHAFSSQTTANNPLIAVPPPNHHKFIIKLNALMLPINQNRVVFNNLVIKAIAPCVCTIWLPSLLCVILDHCIFTTHVQFL